MVDLSNPHDPLASLILYHEEHDLVSLVYDSVMIGKPEVAHTNANNIMAVCEEQNPVRHNKLFCICLSFHIQS